MKKSERDVLAIFSNPNKNYESSQEQLDIGNIEDDKLRESI